MHEVLVNRLGGLSLPRKSVLRLTDRPDMTLDVYGGRKTTIQPTTNQQILSLIIIHILAHLSMLRMSFWDTVMSCPSYVWTSQTFVRQLQTFVHQLFACAKL